MEIRITTWVENPAELRFAIDQIEMYGDSVTLKSRLWKEQQEFALFRNKEDIDYYA